MNAQTSLKDSTPEANRTPAPAATAAEENVGSQAPPAIPSVLPILPVRNTVVFPGTIVPLSIGRPESLKLLEESLPQSRMIGVCAQRVAEKDQPGPDDLHQVGTACHVLKLVRQAEGSALLVVNALQRIRLGRAVQTEPYLRAEIEVLTSVPPPAGNAEWEATVNGLRQTALQLVELTPGAPEELRGVLMNITDAGMLADFIANSLNFDPARKQELLEELEVARRVRAVHQQVSAQLEIARIQQKLQQDVSSKFTDIQRRAQRGVPGRAIEK
jgi:ATP-dependent Lon protease